MTMNTAQLLKPGDSPLISMVQDARTFEEYDRALEAADEARLDDEEDTVFSAASQWKLKQLGVLFPEAAERRRALAARSARPSPIVRVEPHDPRPVVLLPPREARSGARTHVFRGIRLLGEVTP